LGHDILVYVIININKKCIGKFLKYSNKKTLNSEQVKQVAWFIDNLA
jgi:hypothetical protein